MASKTVTLYVDQSVIDKLDQFASATHRSKSGAAEVLILHGLANYDAKTAAPRKMPGNKKATAANTRVKKPVDVKVPRGLKPAADATKPKAKPGRKPRAKASPTADKPAKRRGRPPKNAKPATQEAA